MGVILEVPVPVLGNGIMRRKRTLGGISFLETVPVEVRILSPDEAPVVMRAEPGDGRVIDYRRKDGDNLEGQFWPGRRWPVENRYLDDNTRVLRAVWPENWNEPVTRTTIASLLEELVVASHSGRAQYWRLRPDNPRVLIAHVDPDDYRFFEVPHREADYAPYQEFWSRAAFIDDVLHVPSGGPVWEAAYFAASDMEIEYGTVVMDAVLRLVEEAGFVGERSRSMPPGDMSAAYAALAENVVPWLHNDADPESWGHVCAWSGRILPTRGTFDALSAATSPTWKPET